MSYSAMDHTWIICAYGNSEFLEECILSLKAQTIPSKIMLSTSTPSQMIRELGNKYSIPVDEHSKGGIGGDWNAAYQLAQTPLLTIAHQDDLYEPFYTETMLRHLNHAKDPIIYFSGYYELRGKDKVEKNKNLQIKNIMLLPLRIHGLQGNKWIRRRILSIGNPICCPSVTYVQEKVGEAPFSTEMKVSLDWDQWEKLSKLHGAFVYEKRPQMSHRIHTDSETSKQIENHQRGEEDLAMFQRFWPQPIAQWLEKKYSASEKGNSEQ